MDKLVHGCHMSEKMVNYNSRYNGTMVHTIQLYVQYYVKFYVQYYIQTHGKAQIFQIKTNTILTDLNKSKQNKRMISFTKYQTIG